MELHIKILVEDMTLPSYAHEGDAGLDLRASGQYTINLDTLPEDIQAKSIMLHPQDRILVNTGIALELPKGTFGNIKDRSSLGRQGIHVLGGVIDENYRGEIQVILINLGKKAYEITKNERIAQLVIIPYAQTDIKKAKTLTNTTRGHGKFGSTGKN